jgi:hypothetical protein
MRVDVEVAVRRELGRQGRRWAPVVVAVLLLVAVLATTRPDASMPVAARGNRADQPSPAGGSTADPGAGEAPGPGSVGTPDGADGSGGGAASVRTTSGGPTPTVAGGQPARGGPGATVAGGQPAGNGPAPTTGRVRPAEGGPRTTGPSGGPASNVPGGQRPGGGQVSRTGVTCTGANRQLPESAYGPLCLPAFTGDNGGATSFGVSRDEIVVTYRVSDSASMGALRTATGDRLNSVGLNMKGVGRDMAVLANYFNTRFELYGRKVRFVVFQGQGDVLEEYQYRGAQGAQADAARAKDLGAFADVSYATQTQLYAEAVVKNGIVAFSPIYLSRDWHTRRAPLSHSPMWPASEDMATFQANVVCGALHPGKAERSNDPVIAQKARVFGIVHAEEPEYARIGEFLEQRLRQCGAPVARRVGYALDITTATQQSTNAMAQMRAAGVTTVLCVCDFIVPAAMMEAADKQQWVPEWYMTAEWPEPFYRMYPKRQFAGQLVSGGARPPFLDLEPGKVFRAASGGKAPESPLTLDNTYRQILMLFTGLQAAGPNLTPETMFRGLQQVPSTANGDLGPSEFGPGPSLPRRWFQLGTYDPGATSKLDGEQGGVVSCRGGRYVRFDDVAAINGPLDCPSVRGAAAAQASTTSPARSTRTPPIATFASLAVVGAERGRARRAGRVLERRRRRLSSPPS